MLNSKSEKYATAATGNTAHFSDAAIAPFTINLPDKAADFLAPATAPAPGPHIPLPQAKTLILDALAACDPALRESAAAILNDARRLNLIESASPVMMQCRPAHLFPEDALDFDNEDLKKKFPTIDNDKPYAIIDFEYDGTPRNVIYLAHELGHALADDLQNDAGFTYKDNPAHMQELQAYLVQSIVTTHLAQNPDPALALAARQSAILDTNAAHLDMACALAALDGLNQDKPDIARICEKHFGPAWQMVAVDHPLVATLINNLMTLKQGDPDRQATARTALTTQADRLHYRPMAFLAAAALAGHLQTKDAQTRRAGIDWTLGAHGPKNFNEVLARIGIERESDLGKILTGGQTATADTALTPENNLTIGL